MQTKSNNLFIPEESYMEIKIRYFPIILYKKIIKISQKNHISIGNLIKQCCEFALNCMEEEDIREK